VFYGAGRVADKLGAMPSATCLAASALYLAVASPGGTPFEDTQNRFTLELPRGWTFAPQPGDMSGAAFQRKLNDVPASFAIKIIEVAPTMTLDAFVARLTAGVASSPGYTLVSDSRERMAGLATVRRRYKVDVDVGGGDKTNWVKVVEDWYSIGPGGGGGTGKPGARGYVVHAESLATSFASFEADFELMRRSVRFTGVDPGAPEPFPTELVGLWAMAADPNTLFRLEPDGTFDLAGTAGVWRVNGPEMMTRPLGGGAEVFRWRLVDGELELRHDNLGEPIRYRRSSGGAGAAAPTLTGRWRAKGHEVELGEGGKATVNGKAGTYRRSENLLIFELPGRGKRPKRMVTEFVLEGDRLTLADGDFGDGVVLERVR
jgi:hypothetical protein